MRKQKLEDFRSKSIEELKEMCSEMNARVMEIGFKARIEAPKNPMEKKNLRKDIARINTIITEKEVSNG